MKDRPEGRAIWRVRTKLTKQASFQAAANRFEERVRLSENELERRRWAKTAAHYRELAKLEDEVAEVWHKPPASKA